MPESREFSDEEILRALDYVTERAMRKYGEWVERDDLYQELAHYAYGKGLKHFKQWFEKQEVHRVYLALFGAAKQFGETEKAHACGYDFADLAWYSPSKLLDLLPLALDSAWDGLTGEGEQTEGSAPKGAGREGGSLLAMVADLRRAIEKNPDAGFVVRSGIDQGSEPFVNALVQLADWLGGEFPDAPSYRRERRRVISNDRAIGLTRRTA